MDHWHIVWRAAWPARHSAPLSGPELSEYYVAPMAQQSPQAMPATVAGPWTLAAGLTAAPADLEDSEGCQVA